MKRIKKSEILIISLFCLLTISACEETTSFIITLRTDTGVITGAKVTLKSNSGIKSHVYNQTAEGTSIDFKKVVPGSYTLTVEHNDYWAFTLSDLTVHSTVSGYTANVNRKLIYNKASVSDGWRYLMVAPAYTEFETDWNTAINQCNEMNIDDLTGWVLPDKEQLNILYQQFHHKGLGGFKNEWYWSSSQYSGNGSNAWVQSFDNGNQDGNVKDYTRMVRAVRTY